MKILFLKKEGIFLFATGLILVICYFSLLIIYCFLNGWQFVISSIQYLLLWIQSNYHCLILIDCVAATEE